jgi:hypothetical protein
MSQPEQISTEESRHPQLKPKLVKSVAPARFGHVHLTFTDGSMDVVRREEIATLGMPKTGKLWPPR